MVETPESTARDETLIKDGPRLAALLKEMDGLDLMTSKVVSLTEKVKENKFPTVDGISYLEAKHLLLLCYCQSTVYYLLRKARLSIEGHPASSCAESCRDTIVPREGDYAFLSWH